jgi:DNA-binding NarL/FixJ family response regulator
MSEKRRILVVEDHPIFRLGLRELINQEPDMEVCGESEDVADAWRKIAALQPDLIVADITLPGCDGLDLVEEVHRRCNRLLPVLVLSMHDEFLYAERALHAGARGYIMKQQAMESVVSAIRQVLAGKVYLSERVKEHILSTLAERPADERRLPIGRLADRELEVLRLIGQGLSTREIAGRLHLSVKTIGTYRERLKEKLRLKHANELVRFAVHYEKTGQLPASSEDVG